MIVDRVNIAYPDYDITVKVQNGVKCVPLRQIMRLGNKLPAPGSNNYPWSNAMNLVQKIRNVIQNKTSADPYHAICVEISEHWIEGKGTELVKLEEDMPIIIMQLSKFPPVHDIIKNLGAFIKEKTGEMDEEEDGNEGGGAARADEPPVDEPPVDEPPNINLSEDERKIMDVVRKDVPTDKLVAAMTALKIRLDGAKPANMVRLRVTDDYKMSAIDVIRIVYEHTDDGSRASDIFRNLDQDVKDLFQERVQFDGARQRETPVGGIKSIIYMVLHLNSESF